MSNSCYTILFAFEVLVYLGLIYSMLEEFVLTVFGGVRSSEGRRTPFRWLWVDLGARWGEVASLFPGHLEV
jgi:hypothetical protein